jgi:hypothetical protein
MVLPLVPTDVPGVYRRGSKFVVVYRVDGRQRKQSADTLAGARAIKLNRDGEARALRRGPTLHGFSLSWLDRYAGSGHDSMRANTRREYRRLLVNFALTYFDREVRVRDLDRAAVQHFVDWLTTRPGGCVIARSPTRSRRCAWRLTQRSPKGCWMPTRPSRSCCRGGGRAAHGRRASGAF